MHSNLHLGSLPFVQFKGHATTREVANHSHGSQTGRVGTPCRVILRSANRRDMCRASPLQFYTRLNLWRAPAKVRLREQY